MKKISPPPADPVDISLAEKMPPADLVSIAKKQLGMTDREIADAIGVYPSTICRIRNQQTVRVSVDLYFSLLRLCRDGIISAISAERGRVC